MEAKPPPIGVVTGPFSATRLRSMESIELLGDVLLVLLEGLGAGGIALPLETGSGRRSGAFQDADDGVRDFGADAVAGDQRDSVLFRHVSSHMSVSLASRCASWPCACVLLSGSVLPVLPLLLGAQQLFQLFLEFAHVLEVAIDAGKADIGDGIDAPSGGS